MSGIERGIELDGTTIDFARDIEDPSELPETKELPVEIQETNHAGLNLFPD